MVVRCGGHRGRCGASASPSGLAAAAVPLRRETLLCSGGLVLTLDGSGGSVNLANHVSFWCLFVDKTS